MANESIIAQKKILRREMIMRRKSLTTEECKKLSHDIVQKFLATEIYQKSKIIMAYASMPEEIQLQEIFQDTFAQNKKVALPFIVSRGIMQAVLLPNLDALEVGEFGILTVREDLRKFIDAKEIDCVIVPGVAFDIHGKRLGMGGGYYDRFLRLTDAKKIALAFDFQIVENIPAESHDIFVDTIITERGVRKCL